MKMYDARTWKSKNKKGCACYGNVTPIQLSMLLSPLLPPRPAHQLLLFNWMFCCSLFPPTNGAVLSVPARAAFALAIAARPVFIAAWVTRSLITGGSHPPLLAAAGASDTDAMPSTVRSTNLCGREERKETEGTQGVKGEWEVRVTRDNQNVIVMKKQPHSTTSPDGE